MVAAGLMLVRKAKTPSKILDDVPSAVCWLMPHTGLAAREPAAIADELVLALEHAWA
jgi:hypothetical protein